MVLVRNRFIISELCTLEHSMIKIVNIFERKIENIFVNLQPIQEY